MRIRADHLRYGGLLVCLWAAGCPEHPVVPVSRVELRIQKRGIFVPLPPPSLRAQPVQQVQLEGTLEAEHIDFGTVVRVVDTWGEADVTVPLGENHAFAATFVADLTENCLDVWAESSEGERLTAMQVRAEIVGENDVVAVVGCTVPSDIGETDTE